MEQTFLDTGCPSLHLRVRCGSIGITELLLDSGADPNGKAQDGTVPLQFCYGRNSELTELLMQRGGRF